MNLRNETTMGSFLAMVIMAILLEGLFHNIAVMAATRQEIIEGAKKEGEILYYTATDQSDSTRIVNKFMEKYPFIRARFFRSTSVPLLAKILAELRVGKLPADVIQLGGVLGEIVGQHGGMGDYVSPELEGIPEGFKDPKGLWGSAYMQPCVIGYNTNLVKGSDIPKSYQDLLNPKWKGKKLAFETVQATWLIARIGIMGEEKALQFMQKLAEQELKMFSSKATTRTMLAAGEIPITINATLDQMWELKKNGAPVDWVAVNPVQTMVFPIFTTKTAPHPNAAKLFVDYILSKEGQIFQRSLNRIPTRRDVPPDPPRLIQGMTFYPDKMEEVNRYDEYSRMFNKIFVKK